MFEAGGDNRRERSVCESIMYRGKVLDVLRRQFWMFPNCLNMQLQYGGERKVVEINGYESPLNFRRLTSSESDTTSANQVLWNED